MIPPEDSLDVRGVLISNVIKYIRNRYGENGVKHLMKEVSKRVGRKVKMEEIKEYNWYPHSLFKDFVYSAASVSGKSVETVAEEMGAYSAKNIGIMRFFVKFAIPPEKLIERSKKMWSEYHKIGYIDIVDVKKGRVVFRLVNYFSGPYLCPGFAKNVEEIMKYSVKDAKVREVKCASEGGDYCEFVATWTP